LLTVALVGFVFAFVGSMPIAGPIAAIVLERGLRGRVRSAIAVGAGCALAESGYAFLALWGFSTFLAENPYIEGASRLLACGLLLGLGTMFLRYRGAQRTGDRPGGDTALKSLSLGFGITALNPTLIATWTGATTMLHSTGMLRLEPRMAAPFALGAMLGTAGWSALFATMLGRLGARFDDRGLTRAVRLSGALVMGVGLVLLARFAQGLIARW
jgi:threonine/homoserine/homoserine lactone efflux protein